MNNNYQGESFLNRLYKDLHMSQEVMHTALPSDTKNEKVSKYLSRLERVEELAKNSKYNGLELLKEMYYKKYIIKAENVPESYFETQKRIALERGFGYIEISDNEKKQMIDVIINDQKKSLDIWLDYLISDDSFFPEWFKYYVFQGMLKLGSYDKEKASFNKRTSSTTNLFVDLNREALALVYDNLCNVFDGQSVDNAKLQTLLESGSFSKLYAYMLKKIDSSKKDIADSNDGIWIKYNQGDEPDELVKSLEGKGTGWCTAGIETARSQLEDGDFYVYYTKDSNGEYKQPRIAIRMEDNSIGEIRGISDNQNLESEMEEILDKKLDEFSDKDYYKKKVSDMKILTEIYKEYKNRDLTIEELRFLYEVDNKIDGFGYDDDPRIDEILVGRNFKTDLSKVFNCSEDEVTDDKNDVLKGKKIVCFRGDLNFTNLLNASGLILPDYVSGDLDLRDLKSAEGLVLPSYISGTLSLSGLTSVEGLILPSYIRDTLYLDGLERAQDLILPNYVDDLDLSNLKSTEGLIIPPDFNCGLLVSKHISLNDLKAKSLETGVNQNFESEMQRVMNNKLEELKNKQELSDMGKLTIIYKEYKKRQLTLEELRYLYEIDNVIYDLGYKASDDPRIKEIKGDKVFKRDLANIFGCSEDEISNDKNDVLSGKKIVCFFGNLSFNNLEIYEGLTLPNNIVGSLYLDELKIVERLVLPTRVYGNLSLYSLSSDKGLILPTYVGGDLTLYSLFSAKGLILPTYVGGYLDLHCLDNASDLVLPTYVGGDLDLYYLNKSKDIVLPSYIGETLDLYMLESTEGLIVPADFNCNHVNSDCISIDDLKVKSLDNCEDKSRQMGFSKVGILLLLNIIISIGLIFLGVWFDL